MPRIDPEFSKISETYIYAEYIYMPRNLCTLHYTEIGGTLPHASAANYTSKHTYPRAYWWYNYNTARSSVF